MQNYLENALLNFHYYLNSYNNYKKNASIEVLSQGEIILTDDFCEVEFFTSYELRKRDFLIAPSIINNTVIFKLNNEINFINYLRNIGNVYLINWLNPTKLAQSHNLNDYALHVGKIAKLLNSISKEKIDIIGYCLGGNFALATAVLYPSIINSLILFATPWNFKYLQPFRSMQKSLQLEKAIENYINIPSIYMQILFFLMDTKQSFNKFFSNPQSLNQDKDLQTYFEIERWLYTGIDITKPAYNQLMLEFIEQNITYENKWCINNQCINPTEVHVPTLSILGLKDKIVAADAVRDIYSKISKHNNIEIDVGHIGFFVGSYKEKLFNEIGNWLRGIDE
jgi:polyhydroxyalkanoate synthase